jgi:hypothetical protein
MKTSIVCIALLWLSSCTSIRYVEYDMDRSVDFKQYKTYAWIPSPDVPYKDLRYDNHIIENNIKAYSADNIIAKGLRLSVDSPDLLFYYDLQIEKGTRTMQVPIYSHPQNFMAPIMPINPMVPGIGQTPAQQQLLMQQQLMQQRMLQQQMMMQPPQIIGYETRQIPFKDGTLTIIAIDRVSNRMVWRSWSESCIIDPSNYRETLPVKINRMFNRFPTTK